MEHQQCPRCDSSDTKFCYYNNYSLSQPRYFCKACRRYWTRGGTLRNVPIGGGCRKSKRPRPSASASSNPTGAGMTMIRAPIVPPMGYNGINHHSIQGGAFLSNLAGGGGGYYEPNLALLQSLRSNNQTQSDLIFPLSMNSVRPSPSVTSWTRPGPSTFPWSLAAGDAEHYPAGLNSFDPNRAGLDPSH